MVGLRYYNSVMIDSPDWDPLMDFLGGPTTDPQISTAKIILNGASPALLSSWQDASDKTKIALAVLAAGQFSLGQMPRAASGFLHGKGVGVDPAYDLLVAADIPNLDTAKITTGQFSLTRLPRAASGFLRGKGVGADPAYEALVAADIPSLDTSKITTGRFTAARLLDGTSGYFLKAQGVGVDPLYALLVAADIPNLDTAKITTGRFVAARLLDGASGFFLRAQGAGVDPIYALLVAADIPNLDTSKLTTGLLAIARGGLNNATWTALQLIRMNAGGTAFESSGKTIADFAASSHTHPASDIASGILAQARGGLGKAFDLTGLADTYIIYYDLASDIWKVRALDWSYVVNKPSSFTPSAHQLDSATYHTVSGLTTGHFVKALSPTSFGFAAHGLSYGDVGAAAASHVHAATEITSARLALARLPDAIINKFLRSQGVGSDPIWDLLVAADIPDISATYALAGHTHAQLHDRQHSITSTLDHTSAATAGKILKADVNGLPVDATNTDADVADAVTKRHIRAHTMVSTSDHSDWPVGLDVTELGYVNGVTSAIQTQLDGKAPTVHDHWADIFMMMGV